MEASNPTPPATFEIAARLTVTTCPTCGISYALPTSLYLSRPQDPEPIHCPSGHAHAIALADDSESLLALHAAAVLELAQLRHANRQAECELELLRPKAGEQQAPTREEIVRRARILEARGRVGVYGKRLC